MASSRLYPHTGLLYAQAVVDGVKNELPDAAYFTRDDLLFLPCFMHLATISRYRYVCGAVRVAIDKRWLLEMNRTDLILAGGKRQYANAVTEVDVYEVTVAKLVGAWGANPFTISEVLQQWTTDQHLTTNAKRVILRGVFRRMMQRDHIDMPAFNQYVINGKGTQ